MAQWNAYQSVDESMVREPVIRGDDEPEDDPSGGGSGWDSSFLADDGEYDDALRPQRLSEVVGQRAVVERLEVFLDATRKRNEPLGHLLLDGPPKKKKT
ncbi:MAG: Holliday junction branch migration DNA helicase RuvB, partial [Planctomycetaceae bacterium]|nr:Holliday junction branch migration DNA helicase RuvB [Planctomycetaceae bacterium]